MADVLVESGKFCCQPASQSMYARDQLTHLVTGPGLVKMINTLTLAGHLDIEGEARCWTLDEMENLCGHLSPLCGESHNIRGCFHLEIPG